MTHRNALEGNRAGLAVGRCEGELIPDGSFVDYILGSPRMADDGARPFLESEVLVLRCVACRRYVTMRDGRALNDYDKPPLPTTVRDMVQELALALVLEGPRVMPREPPPGLASFGAITKAAAELAALYDPDELAELRESTRDRLAALAEAEAEAEVAR